MQQSIYRYWNASCACNVSGVTCTVAPVATAVESEVGGGHVLLPEWRFNVLGENDSRKDLEFAELMAR